MASLRRRPTRVKRKGKKVAVRKRSRSKSSNTKKTTRTPPPPAPRKKKAPKKKATPKKKPSLSARRVHRKRSKASSKGWKTRRYNELAAINGLSDYALDFWSELNAQQAQTILDLRWASGVRDWRELPKADRTELGFSNDTRIEVMRVMMRVESKQWTTFSTTMRRLGFSPSQIKTAWFSPKARKK